jgi:hypothetical protein
MLFISSFIKIGFIVCIILTSEFKVLPFSALYNSGTNFQIDQLSTGTGKCTGGFTGGYTNANLI